MIVTSQGDAAGVVYWLAVCPGLSIPGLLMGVLSCAMQTFKLAAFPVGVPV